MFAVKLFGQKVIMVVLSAKIIHSLLGVVQN